MCIRDRGGLTFQVEELMTISEQLEAKGIQKGINVARANTVTEAVSRSELRAFNI
ncbi:hypothetical protein GWK90_09090 [Candidatus Hamiltonella defensa]|nr:hypothetical protein [Candidatus Hamiltonella defensa]